MITNEWLLCSRGAAVDRDSGTVSLFEILDTVQGPRFPLLFQDLMLAAGFFRSPKDRERVKVNLKVHIDKEELFNQQMEFDFQGKQKTNVLANMKGLLIPRPGVLMLGLYRTNGTPYATYKIVASALTQAAIEGSNGAAGKPPAKPKKPARSKKK